MTVTVYRDENQNIMYDVLMNDGTFAKYTVDTVPISIIRFINWNKPVIETENFSTWDTITN